MHDTEEFEQQPFGVVNDYTNLFHSAQNNEHLNVLLERAAAEHVSVVTPNVAHLLETIATLRQPQRILELGTAFGVSTYHMVKALESSPTLVTLDLVAERQAVAKDFLAEQGLDEGVVFLCEDFRAEGRLEALAMQYGPFDMVFLDAAKGQYARLLELLTPHVAEHGVVIFDNIFLNGWIVNDAYPNHRQKTAFVRMKAFLRAVQENRSFSNTLLPLDDGVLVLVKREE